MIPGREAVLPLAIGQRDGPEQDLPTSDGDRLRRALARGVACLEQSSECRIIAAGERSAHLGVSGPALWCIHG